jgi:hypothetical protein
MFTQLRYGPRARRWVFPRVGSRSFRWMLLFQGSRPLPPFAARIITEPLGSLTVILPGSTQRYRTATPGQRTRPEQ